MDNNNRAPPPPGAAGEPALDSGEWRAQLKPDSRQRIVNKIVEILKRHRPLSGQEIELKKIAVRFEEKIYNGATSQSNYMQTIFQKIGALETRSQNPLPSNPNGNVPAEPGHQMQPQVNNQVQSPSIPSETNQSQSQQLLHQNIQNNIASNGVQVSATLPSTLSQVSNMNQSPMTNATVQNLDIQNLSAIPQNAVGNSMVPGVASNMLANSQLQMQPRQSVVPQQQSHNPHQYLYPQQLQQQQQQLIKQKFQQGNMPHSLMQSHIQQQQQFMARQNNISNMHQQHSGPQSDVSGLQQQQLIGTQPGNSSMQPNQHSMQMPKVSLQQQTQQSASSMPTQGLQSKTQSHQLQMMPPHMQSQPPQFQQHPYSLQVDVQQQMQASGSLFQPQNVNDQQKQLHQSQKNLPETSSNSTSQTGQANGGDWQEEVYQKIKAMKEMYFPELNAIYQKIATKLQQVDSLPQQPRSEQLDKLKIFKAMLERIIAFLNLSKSNILPGFKEKLGSYEKQIISLINTNRLRKPAPTMQQGQLPPSHLQPMQQQTQPQVNQVQSHNNQMNLQGSVPAMQQNMTNLHHSPMSTSGASMAQPNVMCSLPPGSNLGSAEGNAQSSLQQVTESLPQTLLSGPQQARMNNLSSENGGNVLQQNTNPLQSSSNLLEHYHLKQQQEQQMLQKKQFQQRQMQMQQQLMQRQQQQRLHQQQQLNQQAKPQVSAQLQTHQMQQIHQVNDDLKMRQGMAVKSGVFQQHHSVGQRSAYTPQQLKPGAPFPTSSPQLLQSPSPQVSQHSSPQIDQQNLLTSLTKAGTPLQSASSPFVVPSPSTPLAPSPVPGDTEKRVVLSLPDAGNVGHQQTSGAVAPAPSLAIGTPGISASPLLAEFTVPNGTHGKSSVIGEPLERLLKEVVSMSPAALSASVSDIGSVLSMIDRKAGSAPGNGYRVVVSEDLDAMTKCHLQARNCITQDGTSGTRKMKRYTSAMPVNVVSSAGSINDSFKQLSGSEMSDLESTATSSVKRPRLEANHTLMKEIREINQRLIDTVVDISEEGVGPTAATAERGEGTIVKCAFSAVALSPDLKSEYDSAQMSPIQPLQLLVPTNYPNCSPVLLDKLPVQVSKDHEDLSMKAKSKFSMSLRSLSEPMSLGEMARTWDVCARAAISEYAHKSGGGSFSSKYDTWESCLSAV